MPRATEWLVSRSEERQIWLQRRGRWESEGGDSLLGTRKGQSSQLLRCDPAELGIAGRSGLFRDVDGPSGMIGDAHVGESVIHHPHRQRGLNGDSQEIR